MADQKLSALSALGNITTADSVYVVDSGTSYKAAALVPYSLCQGRLTLTSGTAVTTADVTSAGTVYWTPYLGDQIGLYASSAWTVVGFTELSISLASGFSSGKNYDVFGFLSSDALAVETLAWTNDSTRAAALGLQNGVFVKGSDHTRRYLGTFRTATSTTSEDSALNRLVYSNDNPVPRVLLVEDGNSHSYGTATWRNWNNTTAARVTLVAGQALVTQNNIVVILTPGSGATAYVGVGADGADPGDDINGIPSLSGSTIELGRSSTYSLAAGYHYLQVKEFAASTSTFNNILMNGSALL